MDKTPQIDEEKLVMTTDRPKKQSFKDTRVSMFSADISKSEEISKWRPIDKALHCNFSATRKFSKNCHNFYQKDPRSFQQWVQQEAK